MEEEKVCGTCEHFAQHYRKSGERYYEVACGHCKYPRVKKRTRDQTCPHWTPANSVSPRKQRDLS